MKEEKLIASMVVECSIVTIMSTHVYSFNGKHYLQSNGGPIGLNSTASLASIIMCWWDRMWIRLLNKLTIKCLLYYRYVDDCRSYLKPIKQGWRVTSDGLRWDEDFYREDVLTDVSPQRMTTNILVDLMNKILVNLVFTGEDNEMF